MNTNKYNGLSNKEVIESRKKHGCNEIIKRGKNSFLSLIIESLNDPIIKILLIALAVKVIFLFNVVEPLSNFILYFVSSAVALLAVYILKGFVK